MKNLSIKKTGIITDFYRQGNYGGILQAYALARLVTAAGYACEQIRYDRKNDPSLSQKIRYRIYLWRHLYPIMDFIDHLRRIPVQAGLDARQRAMDEFIRRNIPFSPEIYDRKTISKANLRYSAFIAGSDQIWSAFSRTNLLDFVAADKKKFAYAASIARDPLGEIREKLFKELLPSFQAVSVRERGSVAQLAELGIQAQWVLDPCLMLDRTEWDTVRSERLVQEPYIFGYFLGNAPKLRKLATEYAGRKGLKLVTLPYLQKRFLNADRDCGDIQLFDVSPADFISLICFADTVLTDSFHGSVFSYLYRKHFLVFGRQPMNMRIESLLHLFGESDKMLDYDKTSLQDMLNISHAPLSEEAEKRFAEMKASSRAFLLQNLAD